LVETLVLIVYSHVGSQRSTKVFVAFAAGGRDNDKPVGQKVEVWAQEIHGIIYYIDKTCNVYQVEDIIANKVNPKVIAKYIKTGDKYAIPEFNI